MRVYIYKYREYSEYKYMYFLRNNKKINFDLIQYANQAQNEVKINFNYNSDFFCVSYFVYSFIFYFHFIVKFNVYQRNFFVK